MVKFVSYPLVFIVGFLIGAAVYHGIGSYESFYLGYDTGYNCGISDAVASYNSGNPPVGIKHQVPKG